MPHMEGKEQRFGVMNSVLWGVSCTAIDNGSVNSMHDSWMPLAGLMPMWNILIGEIMFGGIGCGVYCMLFHVLITVFIAGLMIGRTPEYLGKKLGGMGGDLGGDRRAPAQRRLPDPDRDFGRVAAASRAWTTPARTG